MLRFLLEMTNVEAAIYKNAIPGSNLKSLFKLILSNQQNLNHVGIYEFLHYKALVSRKMIFVFFCPLVWSKTHTLIASVSLEFLKERHVGYYILHVRKILSIVFALRGRAIALQLDAVNAEILEIYTASSHSRDQHCSPDQLWLNPVKRRWERCQNW